MSKNTLLEYAKIKQEIKRLNEQAEELLAEIIPILEEIDPENKGVETDMGIFYKSSRKKWVFSDEVNELEEELSRRKDDEKKIGVATYTELEVVNFRSI